MSEWKIYKKEVKTRRSMYKWNNIDNIKDVIIQKTLNTKTTATGELKLIRENFDTKTRWTLLRSSTDDTITLLKNYDKIPSDKMLL